MFKNLGAFLKSKTFLKHLALALLVWILFFGGAVYYLSGYTRHGDFIVLPNLSKKTLSAAEAQLNSLDLKYVIIDSVYVENSPPGLIFNQNPYAGQPVKKGRNIYLYVTSTLPPLVEMPNLLDKSLRQAKNLLDNNGLKLGQVRMVIDPLPGFVLKQIYNGNTVQAGIKIPKGSVISLEVGKGNTSDTIP
ncbi:MAG TPA: PASTA domain-containing protein [Bacteroidia bacterium]|jgi:beta-lactam-binding protein with PASTA domain|nr:PASTA domain-containing protein [Bacteroidia bacterium]